MAITRFKEKPSTFEYEGVTVGMRKPITAEMEEIARKRSAYMKTIVADILEAKKNETGLPAEGDAVLLLELQQYISGLLCCDPDDATKPWFASSKEKQAELAKDGIDRDIVSDVPAEFHMTAFAKFTGTYKSPEEAAKESAEGGVAEVAETDPLPQQHEPETNTSTSVALSAESQNTSTSIPSASEIGGTTTSATESLTSSSS
jgi:hypothetical protein